jgi:hypothetical protein
VKVSQFHQVEKTSPDIRNPSVTASLAPSHFHRSGEKIKVGECNQALASKGADFLGDAYVCKLLLKDSGSTWKVACCGEGAG